MEIPLECHTFLCCCVRSGHGMCLFQHGLCKNTVASCRVIDQHMGHCTHQPSVLQDGAAAHPLHDAAGLRQQCRVGDAQHHVAVRVGTDSTNLHNDVKRNKIRLDVMPLLRELNPSVSQSIFESSLRVGEALKVFDEAMKQSIADVTTPPRGCTCPKCTLQANHPLTISIDRLKQQPSPEYTLHEILSPRGFTSAQIDQIYGSLDSCSAGKIIASDSHELAFDRGSLLVQPRTNVADAARSMRIPETGTYVFSDSLKIKVAAEDCGDDYVPSRAADCVCLDASDIKFPLTLRHIEQGDRFVPFGMNGMKLVSDYLTDRKKTVFEKRAQLVVTDAQQRIVWLVGERTDNRFRITPHIQQALRLTITVVQ